MWGLTSQIGNNIIMLDPERKLNIFCSRANYQLKEIQYSCRQVVTMSKVLASLNSEIASSEVNCKKIQFFKGEIKDKLKEFAASVDEIFKVLDKKMQMIMLEFKKMENKEEKRKEDSISNKKTQSNKDHESFEKVTNSQTQNLFSDTLNPRVTHLQHKLNEYQANQVKLKCKIAELSTKNQALLEEFNRLSTASNKKINELTSRISKDSFSLEYENVNQPTMKSAKSLQNPVFNNSPFKTKKANPYNYQTEQRSFQLSNEHSTILDPQIDEKPHFLNFGCMPSRSSKPTGNLLGNPLTNDQQYDRLDRNDRNRRFDLLLNKLRGAQQESTEESQTEEARLANEQSGSVFSQNIVQRYQV